MKCKALFMKYRAFLLQRKMSINFILDNATLAKYIIKELFT